MRYVVFVSALSLCAFVLGAVFYGFQKKIIILHYPSGQEEVPRSATTPGSKKVTFFYWYLHKWHHEMSEIMWPSTKGEQITQLLNGWLSCMHEERVLHKKVCVTHVLLDKQEQTAYISFDRALFNKESSTFEKWYCIEGLLKTVRENGIALSSFYFLVQHKPLLDTHLDFSNPWPVDGFISSQP
jgi:hypothetical protein